MSSKQFRRRIDSLFADFERLAADPEAASPRIRLELDALAARLRELERRAAELESAPETSAPAGPSVEANVRPAAPLLYESERVGYVFTGKSLQTFQEEGPVLGDSEKAVVAPLTSGGETIGKMQVEPSSERAWTPEETQLIEAIARQASQQIQSLRLLSATERARAEAEAATRRFMHENWDAFMDAIHQSERIGYAYDQSSVTPFLEPPEAEGVQETINVMDEQVGSLFLQPDPSRPLTNEDKTLVASIAKQVAQQVENIRLLADAARARAEAEEATRRLTRETWEAYAARQRTANLGVVYDLNEVIPLGDAPLMKTVDLAQPLTVRGETIGHLAVAGGKKLSPEEEELTAAIAERVSVHLETLRLAEEIQKRAAELETVAKVSATASTVLDPDELLQSVVDLTKERFGLYHAHIYLANEAWNTLLLSTGAGEVGRALVAEGHAISFDAEKSIVARASRERRAVIANDVRSDPDFLPHRLLPETRSELAVPMIVGDKILGVFDVQSDEPDHFTDEEANIFTTLTYQAGVALQNARLYTEQTATVEQLRELDRLKSSFLANMSHELRTPLNSILGFADVMLEELDGPLTENMQTDLRLIQKNGQHLLHLINDVLDMAKIESGRMNLHPERFAVQELLEEVTSLTSSLASEKNISLFIEPDSDTLVEVNADRTRMRQVMLNLVNNAIKFTERGKIAIRAARHEDIVRISVRDTGIGIPPDHLENIFQEFTQVDTSTTRKVGGTGLGLPISRRLVELHGGRLWAESVGVPGKGSTFFVELPIEARLAEPAE
ncbi:MAG: ATP-binding protein, partial [Chloroflexota bacterium]